MKTVLILAAGVWLGNKIYATLAENRARERDLELRKRLGHFLNTRLPAMTDDEVQKSIATLLK